MNFGIIAATRFEGPVNLTMRRVCRQTPLFITWVDVCAAKDGGHYAFEDTVG